VLKTLRFGPYRNANGDLVERDIPPDTRVYIVSMPGNIRYFDQQITGVYSEDLPAGHFKYTMTHKLSNAGEGVQSRVDRVSGEFYHMVTKEQWSKLSGERPKMVRARRTSRGMEWMCKAPGCNAKNRTRLSAYLHESRVHFGIDPIKEPGQIYKVRDGNLPEGVSLPTPDETVLEKAPELPETLNSSTGEHTATEINKLAGVPTGS